MPKQNVLFLILSVFVALNAKGQELPIGKYSKVNPKCFLFAGKYINIEAEQAFSYHSYSCTYRASGQGIYEYKDGEYVFTFSPKDTTPPTPSSFRVFDDPNVGDSSFKVVVDEGPARERLIGANVYFLDESSEIVYQMSTDLDGSLIATEEHLEQSSLIRIQYTGFTIFDIPSAEIEGNNLHVNLRYISLIELYNVLHDVQLVVRKTDQGIEIKWPADDEFHHWLHSDSWGNEDCYQDKME